MKGMRKTVNGNKITYLRFKIYLDYRAGVLTDWPRNSFRMCGDCDW